MAGALKQSTRLTGLDVCPNPKYMLQRIYGRTMKILLKMPQGSAYRKNTIDIINQRGAVLNSTDDVKTMEEKINCGQIEEVIQQARNELQLAQELLIMKPWERLSTPIPKNQWKWPIN